MGKYKIVTVMEINCNTTYEIKEKLDLLKDMADEKYGDHFSIESVPDCMYLKLDCGSNIYFQKSIIQ